MNFSYNLSHSTRRVCVAFRRRRVEFLRDAVVGPVSSPMGTFSIDDHTYIYHHGLVASNLSQTPVLLLLSMTSAVTSHTVSIFSLFLPLYSHPYRISKKTPGLSHRFTDWLSGFYHIVAYQSRLTVASIPDLYHENCGVDTSENSSRVSLPTF